MLHLSPHLNLLTYIKIFKHLHKKALFFRRQSWHLIVKFIFLPIFSTSVRLLSLTFGRTQNFIMYELWTKDY